MVARALNKLFGRLLVLARATNVLEMGGRMKARRSKSMNCNVMASEAIEAGGEIYLVVTLSLTLPLADQVGSLRSSTQPSTWIISDWMPHHPLRSIDDSTD